MTHEQFYYFLKGYLLAKQNLNENDINSLLDIMKDIKEPVLATATLGSWEPNKTWSGNIQGIPLSGTTSIL